MFEGLSIGFSSDQPKATFRMKMKAIEQKWWTVEINSN